MEVVIMRFFILSFPYDHTKGGTRVLYKLQQWLCRRGHEAMIVTWYLPGTLAYAIRYGEMRTLKHRLDINDDDVAIYAEGFKGNPLGAKRVVRYLFDKTGEKKFDKNEILIAYNEQLAPYANGRILCVPNIEPFFKNNGKERTIDCFFVYKGENTHHPITKDCVEITHKWPKKRKELAELLNRTRTLYTYDDFTILAEEAKRCGCEVKLIGMDRNQQHTIMDYPFSSQDITSESVFEKQLDEFIELTRAK